MPAERVVIVYRGATPIDVKASVIREDKAVGVISEVHAGKEAQRIVVALKSAGALRQNDRYLPFRFEGGTGLKVIAGTGAPLRDGDVVEAGFGWRADPGGQKPTQTGENRSQPSSSGPDDEPRARESVEPRSGAMPPWQSAGPEHDINHAGIQERSFKHVPSALRSRPSQIASEARSQAPAEAVQYLTDELTRVRGEFDAAMQDAHKQGDKEAAREINELRIKTIGMMTRMRVQASRASR